MSVQYTRPSREDFESWFDEHYEYEEAETEWGEIVYDIPLPRDKLSVRVFTTVNKGNEEGRDKGNDAIRTVIWNHNIEKPVGGREHTRRIRTKDDPKRFLKNLHKKVCWLFQNWRAFDVDMEGACPECGNDLVGRESEHGEFLACSDEDCGYTDDLPDKLCPECEGPMHLDESQYGEYYWCEDCDYTEDA